METRIKEYRVTGIKINNADEQQKIFFSCIFATSPMKAESQFKKLMRTQQKIKPRNLVIAKTEELKSTDGEITIKNYGINLKYRSSKSTHNIYKELRSIDRPSAVAKLYSLMAGTHKVRSENIDIIDIREISLEECKRPLTIELNNKDLELRSFKKILIKGRGREMPCSEKAFY